MTLRNKIFIGISIVVLAAAALGGYIFYDRTQYRKHVEERKAEFRQQNPELFASLEKRLQEATEEVKKEQDETKKYNAFVDIGVISGQFGDIRAAEKVYKAAIKLRPRGSVPWHNLASLYRDSGKYTKAAETWGRMLNIFPDEIQAYQEIASLYIDERAGSREEGERFLLKAADYRHPSILLTVARYYRDWGKKDEARKWYQEVLKADPNNQAAKEELGQISN